MEGNRGSKELSAGLGQGATTRWRGDPVRQVLRRLQVGVEGADVEGKRGTAPWPELDVVPRPETCQVPCVAAFSPRCPPPPQPWTSGLRLFTRLRCPLADSGVFLISATKPCDFEADEMYTFPKRDPEDVKFMPEAVLKLDG